MTQNMVSYALRCGVVQHQTLGRRAVPGHPPRKQVRSAVPYEGLYSRPFPTKRPAALWKVFSIYWASPSLKDARENTCLQKEAMS